MNDLSQFWSWIVITRVFMAAITYLVIMYYILSMQEVFYVIRIILHSKYFNYYRSIYS